MEQYYDPLTNDYRNATDPPPGCPHGPKCVNCWLQAHPADVDADLGSGL